MATISAAVVCFGESHNDGSAGKGFVRVNNMHAWMSVCVCVCKSETESLFAVGGS